MNREIKFRAWDENNEVMLRGEDFPDKVLKDGVIHSEIIANLEVMQFTGLKDKNGKEIYEGDIFKAENGNWEIRFGDWILFHEKHLTPIMNGWYALRKENAVSHQREIIPNHIEVIGNIYENKELLK